MPCWQLGVHPDHRKTDRPMSRRVALVTGGARRLGAAIAEGLASDGFDVVIHHGHSPDEARALASGLRETHPIEVEVVQGDLSNPSTPADIVESAVRRFGALDVVVSSASVMEPAPFGSVTIEHWSHTEAVNLRAPFFLMQAAASHMREGGLIVQMSDHLAFETGYPQLMVHQATKAAVTTLVRTMAAALGPRIRVNAIAPGMVLPPEGMSDIAVERFLRDVPLRREGTPADVVHAIRYLIQATYVTGEVIHVDGGRHLRR